MHNTTITNINMLNKHINKIISAPACTRIRDCIPKKDIENSTPMTIENKICSVSISDLKKKFFLNETSLPVKINIPKKKYNNARAAQEKNTREIPPDIRKNLKTMPVINRIQKTKMIFFMTAII